MSSYQHYVSRMLYKSAQASGYGDVIDLFYYNMSFSGGFLLAVVTTEGADVVNLGSWQQVSAAQSGPVRVTVLKLPMSDFDFNLSFTLSDESLFTVVVYEMFFADFEGVVSNEFYFDGSNSSESATASCESHSMSLCVVSSVLPVAVPYGSEPTFTPSHGLDSFSENSSYSGRTIRSQGWVSSDLLKDTDKIVSLSGIDPSSEHAISIVNVPFRNNDTSLVVPENASRISIGLSGYSNPSDVVLQGTYATQENLDAILKNLKQGTQTSFIRVQYEVSNFEDLEILPDPTD